MADAGVRGQARGVAQRRMLSLAGRLEGVLGRDLSIALLLGGILLIALALRTTNVNWDESQHLHPDERFLSMVTSDISFPDSVGEYFDSANSPLNPYND